MHAFPGQNDVERNSSILKGRHHTALKLTDRALLTANAMEQTEALHLIAEMLRFQPEDRRAIEELLRHPWWLWAGAALPFCLMPLCIIWRVAMNDSRW